MKGKVQKLAVMMVVFAGVAGFLMLTNGAQGTTTRPLVCGQIVDESIVLNDADQTNLQNCPVNGLVVGANGITIDGSGCSNGMCVIDGIGNGNGISLNGKSNVVIKNLEIREFMEGVYSPAGNNNKIIDNNVHDNADVGIYWQNGNNFYVSDNIIERNSADGIGVVTSNGNLIKSNRILNNGVEGGGHGLSLYGTINSYIEFNSILLNENGIHTWSNSNGNFILYNYFEANNIQAIDEGINNWNSDYPYGGNVWRFNSQSPACADVEKDGGTPLDSPFSDGICDVSEGKDLYPKTDISFNPQTIALQPEFNFISAPLMPAEGKLPDFLTSIDGRYDVLMYFDSSTGKWKTFNPLKPASLNSLKEIKENMGFWIYINGGTPVDLSVDGASPTNARYDLRVGLNQISYPNNIPSPISSVLANVNSYYNEVWEYDAATDSWSVYEGPTGVNTIGDMKPGHGYWVDANQDVQWDFLNGEGKYYLA